MMMGWFRRVKTPMMSIGPARAGRPSRTPSGVTDVYRSVIFVANTGSSDKSVCFGDGRKAGGCGVFGPETSRLRRLDGSAAAGPALAPDPTEVCVMEHEAIVRRVRAEFVEMPGLKLTVNQAARLWGLDRSACEAVIRTLTASAFIRRTPCGSIVRAEH